MLPLDAQRGALPERMIRSNLGPSMHRESDFRFLGNPKSDSYFRRDALVGCREGEGTDLRGWTAHGPDARLRRTQTPFCQDCGVYETRLSLSAIRPSSGSDLACIFRIRWLRWTFTVTSLMPKSPAICLLRRPRATWTMISRSRGLSDS